MGWGGVGWGTSLSGKAKFLKFHLTQTNVITKLQYKFSELGKYDLHIELIDSVDTFLQLDKVEMMFWCKIAICRELFARGGGGLIGRTYEVRIELISLPDPVLHDICSLVLRTLIP